LGWTPSLLAASPPTKIRGKSVLATLSSFLHHFFFFKGSATHDFVMLSPPLGCVSLFVLLWEKDFVAVFVLIVFYCKTSCRFWHIPSPLLLDEMSCLRCFILKDI
jgi:hypothetical protein